MKSDLGHRVAVSFPMKEDVYVLELDADGSPPSGFSVPM
jgi:hypothetical protein